MTTATPVHARRLVVASLAVTGVTAVGGSFAKGESPPLRIGFGLLFAGVVLSVGAEVAPDLAGSFAMLLMFTSLFVYGGPALAAFNRLIGAPTSPPPAGAAAPSPHTNRRVA